MLLHCQLTEEFYQQTGTFAVGFLLAQILFVGALVAVCCGGFGGGGSSDAPVADAGLPLYTLGGRFGWAAKNVSNAERP